MVYKVFAFYIVTHYKVFYYIMYHATKEDESPHSRSFRPLCEKVSAHSDYTTSFRL